MGRSGGACAALLLLVGCGRGPQPAPVIVFGIDGLEPSVVEPLLRAGRLPALASLVGRGVHGTLGTSQPCFSPLLWTTVATGREPAGHGITWFHDEDGVPFTSNARRTPALWNLASDAGLSCDVYGWWNTWPAEPVRGRMVSSYAASGQYAVTWKGRIWDALPDQVFPAGEAADVAGRSAHLVGTLDEAFEAAFGFPPGPPQPLDAYEATVRWTLMSDRLYAGLAAEAAGRTDRPDLLMAYVGLPDVAGHRFWRYHRPRDYEYAVDPNHVLVYGDAVRDAVIAADRWLGRILEEAGPDANILVVSDHGMGPELTEDTQLNRTTHQSGGHQHGPPGFFAAAGPGFRHDARPRQWGHLLDVAPTVLGLLGLPADRAMPGRAMAAALDDVWLQSVGGLPSREDFTTGFRPATASRRPGGEVEEAFLEWFGELGYFDLEDG